MKVQNIKSGLQKLLPVLETWEAKKVVKDFQKLIELMDGYEDMTIDAFCKKAKQGLDGRPAGSKSSSSLRQELVEAYVKKLTDASSDDMKFSSLIQEVASDKKVRLKELKAIATDFMGVHPLSRKKVDLLDEINTKRARDLRTGHKIKLLSNW